MAHARQQIREALVDALKSSVPEVSNRVYASRVYNLSDDDLPAICLYTMNENQDRKCNEILSRDLEVIIQCYVKETDTYDNTLDAICVGVEAAVKVVSDAASVVNYINPLSHDVTLEGNQDKPITVMKITLTANYTTAFGVADVIT